MVYDNDLVYFLQFNISRKLLMNIYKFGWGNFIWLKVMCLLVFFYEINFKVLRLFFRTFFFGI